MLTQLFFGPYLLAGVIAVFGAFYWATIADAREDKHDWWLFGFRTPEDYRKQYGDRPPY